jgi:hypothetical protein
VIATDETLKDVERLFVNVTVFAELANPTTWFPNDSVAGDIAACRTPVPVNDTVCGLLLAASVRVRVPVRLPVVVGVKVTLIVQLEFAASDVPQVFVWL